MRPIRLEIQGFTSFRNRASLDFNDMEVFSIIGENGAGKSSLLEAMLFALYGQTPRMQGVAKKDLVSQGSNELKVLFEFSSGERVYRVTRSFKIKGTPFAKIEKYKDGDWATVADKDGEVTREVERILRLPYNAFTKAVIIPQGQFDKFLKPDSPSERRNILIKMFDLEIYERMRGMASDIKGKAEQEEEKIQYKKMKTKRN